MIPIDGLKRKTCCLVFILLLPLLLASCGYIPAITTVMPGDWHSTMQHRQQIDSWKVLGRLGVQTEQQGGSLDLFWNQEGESYNIRLIAPMGQGAILIRGNKRGVNIKTADGERNADNADALLAENFGISVPVTGLRDWLRGLPMKNKPVAKQSWDENGQLYKLVQDDWNVEMSNYKKVGEHQLPHNFFLSRDDRPELGIRLLIRRWTLPAERTPA